MFDRRLLIAPFAAAALFVSAARGAEDAPSLVGKDTAGWKLRNEKASVWKVVGDVKMSEKNNKELDPSGDPGATPILVNDLKSGKHGCDIYTEKEFGDCEVHAELMVPKGSNSGVYLMGRYEVQVYDSFDKAAGKGKKPTAADLGGIYATKEPIAENYEPKAPGEWQTLDITFQTPRFDADGKKTANAKFLSVKLNGKEIQKDVEAPKPTGSEISSKEVAKGPLLLQGDHGPVAFRNLRVTETAK